MKILVQNSIFYPKVIGGAEISSHLLAIHLSRRGWEVNALATTGQRAGAKELRERPLIGTPGVVYEAPSAGFYDIYQDGAHGQGPGIVSRCLHHASMVHSPRWLAFAREAFARARPDVLHTNTIAGMTPAIWKAANEQGIRIVHTLRDYHLLCPRTTLLRSTGRECLQPPLPCRALAAAKLSRTHGVDIVTAPSRFVLDRHLENGAFSAARSEVVPNACEEFESESPPRSAEDPPAGLYLGQMSEHKGIRLLLRVLSTLFEDPPLSQLRFDFAGSGPLSGLVSDFCCKYPDRATFHGMVQKQEKETLLRNAAWMAVPSIWNEPFSRAILDAFSWGIPAICTRRGGMPEVLRDGQEGWVVEPTVESFAQAIRSYVESPALRLAHGSAAKNRAEHFSLERQIDRFEALYRSLV